MFCRCRGFVFSDGVRRELNWVKFFFELLGRRSVFGGRGGEFFFFKIVVLWIIYLDYILFVSEYMCLYKN